jgi:hypothetical protein
VKPLNVLMCGASVMVLLGIFIPAHARIGTNVYGISEGMFIYSNDYEDELPRAGGRNSAWSTTITMDYVVDNGEGEAGSLEYVEDGSCLLLDCCINDYGDVWGLCCNLATGDMGWICLGNLWFSDATQSTLNDTSYQSSLINYYDNIVGKSEATLTY